MSAYFQAKKHFVKGLPCNLGFPQAQMVKHLPAMQETQV